MTDTDLAESLNLELVLADNLALAVGMSSTNFLPLDRFKARPMVEPILRHAWPTFDRRLTSAYADRWVDSLVGRCTPRQTGQGRTLPGRDGSRVIFASSAEPSLWWQRINGEEDLNHPLASACFAYAQTVLSHAYQDGNGRLARVMYIRSLARSGLLAGPLLPLGPLVYANARVHDGALQHLGTTGDWDPFVKVMLGLTRKAAAFTRHVMAEQSRAAPQA